ncbi:MAG: cyclase family protein [Crocinitomicaceae bacterium]|nr:cyclase family protein [Crocinitomicaceae bacterium]
MIIKLNDKEYVRTEEPIDLSISIHTGDNAVLAWYCDPIRLEPVITDRFIGEVKQGGSVNFRNLFMNPHGNGTHTECVGHISFEDYSINQCLKEFHFMAILVTVDPEEYFNPTDNKKDRIVTCDRLKKAIDELGDFGTDVKAIVVRTLPNSDKKLSFNYSNTNPTYFAKEAIEMINEMGFEHLIVDQPSIDREEDAGVLIGHHTFWNYPDDPQFHKTITELVYIPENIHDGRYFLNMQITSLENDASPSKITMYKIHH